jgi:hypothetical protein
VDFQDPLSPATSAVPVLTITPQGASVVVSWTNGPGFVLQSTPALQGAATSWTNLGTQNPQTIPVTGRAQYFRLTSP